jgi:hypothetical protein
MFHVSARLVGCRLVSESLAAGKEELTQNACHKTPGVVPFEIGPDHGQWVPRTPTRPGSARFKQTGQANQDANDRRPG